MDGAGAALGQATAEPGAIEIELVAQHVQERRVGGRRHAMALAVDRDLERVRHGS